MNRQMYERTPEPVTPAAPLWGAVVLVGGLASWAALALVVADCLRQFAP